MIVLEPKLFINPKMVTKIITITCILSTVRKAARLAVKVASINTTKSQ